LKKRGLDSSTEVSLKGEVTVVLAPVDNRANQLQDELAQKDNVLRLLTKLRDDGVARSRAVRMLSNMLQASSNANQQSTSKSEIYRIALTIPWPGNIES
jgi:hypothetical protein